MPEAGSSGQRGGLLLRTIQSEPAKLLCWRLLMLAVLPASFLRATWELAESCSICQFLLPWQVLLRKVLGGWRALALVRAVSAVAPAAPANSAAPAATTTTQPAQLPLGRLVLPAAGEFSAGERVQPQAAGMACLLPFAIPAIGPTATPTPLAMACLLPHPALGLAQSGASTQLASPALLTKGRGGTAGPAGEPTGPALAAAAAPPARQPQPPSQQLWALSVEASEWTTVSTEAAVELLQGGQPAQPSTAAGAVLPRPPGVLQSARPLGASGGGNKVTSSPSLPVAPKGKTPGSGTVHLAPPSRPGRTAGPGVLAAVKQEAAAGTAPPAPAGAGSPAPDVRRVPRGAKRLMLTGGCCSPVRYACYACHMEGRQRDARVGLGQRELAGTVAGVSYST